MGTQYRVTLGVASAAETELAELKDDVDKALVEFNAVFSTYEPDSEISRFNNSAAGEVFVASDSFWEAVDRSLQIAEDSGGTFDPTVGPIVNRWQFGPGRKQLKPPSEEETAELLKRVGWKKVRLQSADGKTSAGLVKDVDGLYLDLSAIAKGRGVDTVCELLRKKGYGSFLVDIGGELRAEGIKPDGQPWKVAVRDPVEPFNPQKQSQPAALNNAAMATSGDYFNFYEVDGIRYSHTIDPRSGRPVTHELASVTVLACDCETADAYATTLMVLGPDEGYSWAADRQIAAMLVEHDSSVRMTPRYGDWIRTGEIQCPR